MKILTVFAAALLGVSLAAGAPSGPVAAQTIQVMRSSTSRDLNVPVNRAVVVESDVIFSEINIANPAIADFFTLSDRTIYVQIGRAHV